MPYPRKDTASWLQGHVYHIYNRGVQKTTLFREHDNYLYVIRKAKGYCVSLQLSVIAYCLMPNHYHFLVRQDGEHPAGLLLQRIFNGYSKAYNLRYGSSGTLFERRYQVRLVESSAYLLHLCRYIHANPVKDGLVDNPEDWQYSNYPEWIGHRIGRLVDRVFIQEHFESAEAYVAFVDEYIRTRQLPVEVERHIATIEGDIHSYE